MDVPGSQERGLYQSTPYAFPGVLRGVCPIERMTRRKEDSSRELPSLRTGSDAAFVQCVTVECSVSTSTARLAAVSWLPGSVYLGRTFESPELVFVRSLEVDA
jgi:hypothetical protein